MGGREIIWGIILTSFHPSKYQRTHTGRGDLLSFILFVHLWCTTLRCSDLTLFTLCRCNLCTMSEISVLHEILSSCTCCLEFYIYLSITVEKHSWNDFCIIARNLKLTFMRRNKAITFYYQGFLRHSLGRQSPLSPFHVNLFIRCLPNTWNNGFLTLKNRSRTDGRAIESHEYTTTLGSYPSISVRYVILQHFSPQKELSKNFPSYLSGNGRGDVKSIFKEVGKQTKGLSLETSSCKF